MLKLNNEDIQFFKSIHPEKSSITNKYRNELFLGLKQHIYLNYYSSEMPSKEFYDFATSDFKQIKPSDEQINIALKVIAVQITIAGRVKSKFLRVQDKDIVNLGIYTEIGRKGDLYYALAECVEDILDRFNIIPGIIQWVWNSGFDIDKRLWKYCIPRSHVLEDDAKSKKLRKTDVEVLLNCLSSKKDLTKVVFTKLKFDIKIEEKNEKKEN
jgi:hypothetical protein